MPTKAFITGIAGFAGSYLAESLIESGEQVEGTCLPDEPLANIKAIGKKITLHRCDICDAPGLTEAIRKARPDTVYHLAAISSVPQGEDSPKKMLETNFMGTMNLVRALLKEAPKSRLIFISSSEVYGRVQPEDNPVRESQPLAPIHFYGFTKLISEQFLRNYHRTKGFPVVLLRPFNHIGPRQSERFVCSSFAKQVAGIDKKRLDPVLHVGNLEPVRDFTDVRDMVQAYRLAALHCKEGTPYQIASGQGVPVKEMLNEIISFSDVPIQVRQNPSLVRNVEIPVLTGNASRFTKATGWQKTITLTDSLKDIYRYWKKKWKKGEATGKQGIDG